MDTSIKEIVKNKRIYEIDDNQDYYILEEDKVKKLIFFDFVIAIKQGDLPYPKRWIRCFEDEHPKKGQVLPIEEYNRDDFEYIFMPEHRFPQELQEAFRDLGCATSKDEYKSENFLIELDEIPNHLLPLVKDNIIKSQEDAHEPYEKEFYEYVKDGETHYLLVSGMESFIMKITGEVTDEFQNIETEEVYKVPSKNMSLFKVNDLDSKYRSNWFMYSTEDPNFPRLKELHDIEDLIMYTDFTKLDSPAGVK